ncbi:hypothetical protein T05_571 [Trichinella murrelli]|uniref:Uncharacterized protein n=1 Tax=Trichinella murrelli TaxID=144512 RepID=A0A0V0TFS1_9BILA|nr:hypothetical protein T05_571 [Trichinella murrelli]
MSVSLKRRPEIDFQLFVAFSISFFYLAPKPSDCMECCMKLKQLKSSKTKKTGTQTRALALPINTALDKQLLAAAQFTNFGTTSSVIRSRDLALGNSLVPCHLSPIAAKVLFAFSLSCIFTMLFSYLTISFSLLFHTIVSTPLQWESGHNSKPASSFIDSSKANVKFCFESEPCLFGQYKEQHNDLLAYVKIPSWCVCMDDQKCLASRWDRNKKAEIYTCQPILR